MFEIEGAEERALPEIMVHLDELPAAEGIVLPSLCPEAQGEQQQKSQDETFLAHDQSARGIQTFIFPASRLSHAKYGRKVSVFPPAWALICIKGCPHH